MVDDSLTVHRLRIVCDRALSPHGMGARIEDALRVASRPPSFANRFVLIRRLRLTVPRGATPQSIALLLERQWEQALRSAQWIDHATDDAEAVWALGEAQARLALLTRWLDARLADAWFWKRLAPTAANPAAPLPQRVAQLLAQPWSEDAPTQGLQSWSVQALHELLVRHGLLQAVREALPSQVREWLPAALPEPAPRRHGAGGAALWSQPARAAGLREAAADQPLNDADAENPATQPVPFAAVAAPDSSVPWAGSATGPDTGAPAGRIGAPLHASLEPLLDHARWLHPTPAAPAQPPQPDAAPPSRPPPRLGGHATPWAGLWLLPAVLVRQGFGADVVAAHADARMQCAHVFAALLWRLHGRYRFDAVAAAWVQSLMEQTALLQQGEPAAALQACEEEAAHWERVARVACVREARLPLLRLLRRRGEVLAAPHRLDVAFPLHAADIRIRRAGFDIDLGFLPWLGAVLRYHYQ